MTLTLYDQLLNHRRRINRRRHLRENLHPFPKGVQPLRHDRPRRLPQLLSVNQRAFTGRRVLEF